MIRRLLLASVFILSACTETQNQIASDFNASVVGGEDVTMEDPLARSVVALEDEKTNMLCAATLLSDQHAITAAHCLVQGTENLRLIFETDATKRKLITRAVVDSRVCPTFDPVTQSDPNCDVALIKFSGGLPEGYQPVGLLGDAQALRTRPRRLRHRPLVTVIGYGMNNTDTWMGEGTLRKVRVPIFNSNFSENEFLLDQRRGRGACHGDSGSGIFLEIEGQPPLLAGVVNRGYKDLRSKCNVFGVGLRVPTLYGWILSNLAAL